MVQAGWIETMNADYDDEIYEFYENIEAATRNGFDIEEQEKLFDELKEFCNYNKRSCEQLPDQEITNILNFFINDIHNMDIKYHNEIKLKTSDEHINSQTEAKTIFKNLKSIKKEKEGSNRILIKAINDRINQIKNKYRL